MIVYNVFGQKVATLLNETREAGYHTVEWNGLTESGTTAATGVYFVRMNAGEYTNVKKILLMK